MTTVNYYKIYCNTDSQYEYVWAEESPTVCPVNDGHTVDLTSVSIEQEISESVIKIQEENIPTGENFMAECHNICAATGPDVVTSTDFSWPFPINVLEIQLVTREENLGDDMTLAVAPNTVVGAITATVATGATGANVTQTVVDNIMLGYHVGLTDGPNSSYCGRVIGVDKANNKILFETASDKAYSPLSPTYVTMTVHVVDNYYLGPSQRYVIGEGKIGGSYVPANTIVRVIYRNRSAQSKCLSAQLEYLY